MDNVQVPEDDMEEKFNNLCLDLNMDLSTKASAMDNYLNIKENYILEGNPLHWLACSLYVSCRKSVIPTVGSGNIEGNCVSLTRLIRSSQLSLLEFFKKMKKWLDMSNLPQDFREKIERLERNFAVSTVIFKKFEPIFLDIFNNPAADPPKQQRSRKQRRLPCTVSEVFNFCWTMFVQVKGNFPAISDDLVNSYHLLLCCIDWFYANALIGDRRDLLRSDFSGLPENYMSKDYKPPTDVPCLIKLLCDKHEGLVVEAKTIKEHWFRPYVKKLFDKKTLRGDPKTLCGVLDRETFEVNSKDINHAYEEYVLSVGDFDERVFLGEDAHIEIGTPAKISGGLELRDGFYDRLGQLGGPTGGAGALTIQQHVINTKSLCPPTPLTGRRWLKENDVKVTPVSTATQSVGKLQTLLSGRKTTPSETLLDMFKQCSQNPLDSITARVKDMGEIFCKKYVQSSEEHPGSHIDFARKRLQLAECLYFKTLENIMLDEKQRLDERHRHDKVKPNHCDFSGILGQDIFHRSLFACCLEIVIFSYNSQRAFPWIIEIFELPAYSFYKVIEVLIKVEEGLSRDVVKHLNYIEESVLEQLAWREASPLWEVIRHEQHVPSVEDVSFPSQIERDDESSGAASRSVVAGVALISPMMNPALRRVAAVGGALSPVHRDVPQSPTSAADRFMSPGSGAKRRLFGSTQEHGSHFLVNNRPPQTAEIARPPSNGGSESSTASSTAAAATNPSSQPAPGSTRRPRKQGSLALFLRKMYHLASVRLRDMCERLDVEGELPAKMWTCFEHVIMQHTALLEERHLDLIIMCCVYVMAKVTGQDRTFQDIVKCYRLQPQSQSHVYRNVLLHKHSSAAAADSSATASSRRRPTSAGSDRLSNGGGSGSSSPEEAETRRTERLSSIRSHSAMPAAQPDSQPPTPTRLTPSCIARANGTAPAANGSAGSSEDERSPPPRSGSAVQGERVDLIKFYNDVFVVRIKEFAIKFSKSKQAQPPLSPFPVVRAHPLSPRRVSHKHSVYVSPHKQTPLTPNTKMLYCFSRSPAKDLRAINNMLRLNEKGQTTMKRLALSSLDPTTGGAGADDGGDGATLAKRLCATVASPMPIFSKRLESVVQDRQKGSAAAAKSARFN